MTLARLIQPQRACPHCDCCTDVLCRRAAVSLRGCQAHTPAACRAIVADCPCSARAIAAAGPWRAAQIGGPVQAGPAAPAVSSAGSGLLVGGASDPSGVVPVRQVTATAVYLVRQSADVVRVAGGEPW